VEYIKQREFRVNSQWAAVKTIPRRM